MNYPFYLRFVAQSITSFFLLKNQVLLPKLSMPRKRVTQHAALHIAAVVWISHFSDVISSLMKVVGQTLNKLEAVISHRKWNVFGISESQ